MQKSPLHAAGGALPAVSPSRRAALAALVASPMAGAAALPALVASTAPDPIFAAIAKWRTAKQAWLAALHAHDRLEEQVDTTGERFEIGTCDHVEDGAVVHVDQRFASTVEELDRHVAAAKKDPIIIKVDGSEVCSRITMKRGIDVAEIRAALVRGRIQDRGRKGAAWDRGCG
jgi:hypothetical protein